MLQTFLDLIWKTLYNDETTLRGVFRTQPSIYHGTFLQKYFHKKGSIVDVPMSSK